MADVSISKSSQKNKKRRAKKKEKESTSADVEKDEIDEEPSPVVEEVNPIELIKQKIEEAKLAKDHKKAQQLREQLWALQDQAAGRTVKDAPEIDAALFQPAVKVQSTAKPKIEVATSDESNDKRLKQLRKKLDQITKLKEKQEKGETLEHNQLAKLETEQDILDEISAIEEVYRQLTLR